MCFREWARQKSMRNATGSISESWDFNGMSSQTINFGVIGCGRIGRIHAENLVTRFPHARLMAMADVALSAARELATRLRVEKVSVDYQALLSDPALDAVVICSSTDTHSQIIQEAA